MILKFKKNTILTSGIFFSIFFSIFFGSLTNAQSADPRYFDCMHEIGDSDYCLANLENFRPRATTSGAACTNNANCKAGEFCNTGTGFCGPIVTPTPTLPEGPSVLVTPTPYTGGSLPGGVGSVTTPGYCGGDPNLVWDSAAKMCFPKTDQCTEGSIACSKSLSDLIVKIINYLLIFAGMIAVLAVIIGGFWYITAAGNEEQSEKGKKAIINAIIGIVVITLAFLIIRVISHTLTSGSV